MTGPPGTPPLPPGGPPTSPAQPGQGQVPPAPGWTPGGQPSGLPASTTGSSLPPLPQGYAAATPPTGRPGRRLSGRLIIGLAIAALLVGGLIFSFVARQNSRFTIVTSSSTDGTFNAGDCVNLSNNKVVKADCTATHNAQIIQIIHPGQSCPGGTTEFDVNDGTGNMCLDKGNSRS